MKAQKRFWRIVRTVSCDSRIISGIFRRSDERIVTIAVSIAMSLPRPMATLKSACARAALSLIPSPAMATVRPSDCNCRTNPAFSCGRTPARKRVIPAFRAVSRAEPALSPVSIQTVIPSACSRATAPADEGFSASARASTASVRSSSANQTTVFASCIHPSASRCRRTSGTMPWRDSRASFPAYQVRPSATPRTPCPGMLSNPVTGTSRSPPSDSTTACESGCPERFSRLNRIRRAVSDPSAHAASTTDGRPSVSVPVLSSTTVSTFRATSRLAASLTRMPCPAPLPIPTMRAVGVASPSAQGHAMISTVTSASSPRVKPSSGAKSIHAAKVSTARTMMAGTKTPAIRSTVRCTGALLPCASRTMRMIRASTVSCPTLSARKRNAPLPFIVPANTAAPSCLQTGSGSPLSMLSSTYDAPSATVPSTAMRSPGCTATRSPARSSATGTERSPEGVITVTVFGCRPISFAMAVVVPRFARSSSSRPSRMKATMTAADSK